MEVNREGVFVKWIKLIDVETRVENMTPTGSSVPTATVPGVSFPDLIKPYVGKKVRIQIEVLNEG